MVRGTFSPARAWRPAVVARLARTLGFTIDNYILVSVKTEGNRWMFQHHYEAAAKLPADERVNDIGAFFCSLSIMCDYDPAAIGSSRVWAELRGDLSAN